MPFERRQRGARPSLGCLALAPPGHAVAAYCRRWTLVRWSLWSLWSAWLQSCMLHRRPYEEQEGTGGWQLTDQCTDDKATGCGLATTSP